MKTDLWTDIDAPQLLNRLINPKDKTLSVIIIPNAG
jgi:hypothetical protein